MATAQTILEILAVVLPIAGTAFWAWWKKKGSIDSSKKESEQNAVKEPTKAIDTGKKLENEGTSLENAADKW
jgi:hypothetical protein